MKTISAKLKYALGFIKYIQITQSYAGLQWWRKESAFNARFYIQFIYHLFSSNLKLVCLTICRSRKRKYSAKQKIVGISKKKLKKPYMTAMYGHKIGILNLLKLNAETCSMKPCMEILLFTNESRTWIPKAPIWIPIKWQNSIISRWWEIFNTVRGNVACSCLNC